MNYTLNTTLRPLQPLSLILLLWLPLHVVKAVVTTLGVEMIVVGMLDLITTLLLSQMILISTSLVLVLLIVTKKTKVYFDTN